MVTFLGSNVRNFLTDDWLKIFNVIKDLMSRGYPELINSFTEEDAKILEASLNVLKKEMAENGKGGRHQTFIDLQRTQLEENYNEGDSFVRYELPQYSVYQRPPKNSECEWALEFAQGGEGIGEGEVFRSNRGRWRPYIWEMNRIGTYHSIHHDKHGSVLRKRRCSSTKPGTNGPDLFEKSFKRLWQLFTYDYA